MRSFVDTISIYIDAEENDDIYFYDGITYQFSKRSIDLVKDANEYKSLYFILREDIFEDEKDDAPVIIEEEDKWVLK